MRKEEFVMFNSPEAASFQTVSGWVDSKGRFWGQDEDQARYCGSTHRNCKNNPAHPIHETNGYCKVCREERMDERFLKMDIKDWKDEPLVIYDGDTYFFDADSLRDYLLECDEEPEQVRLCICEPNMPREIDPSDYFCDDLPEDGELNDDQLVAAFDLVNEMIRKSGPLSWSQGQYVARLPPPSSSQKSKLCGLPPNNPLCRHRAAWSSKPMANNTAAQASQILPRFIRAGDAYGYLGMCRDEFNKTVRPFVREFPIGKQGVGFDRLELDDWADAYVESKAIEKAANQDNNRPRSERRGDSTWRKKEFPASTSGMGSGISTRSSEVHDFKKALGQVKGKKQSNT